MVVFDKGLRWLDQGAVQLMKQPKSVQPWHLWVVKLYVDAMPAVLRTTLGPAEAPHCHSARLALQSWL
jgi:hypothetical protein